MNGLNELAIRWLIRRDMPQVLGIERASFEYAWTEEDFLYCLRQRNCIGMVAEDNAGRVVGFMVWEWDGFGWGSTARLLNFAVAAEVRRCGVGTALLMHLIESQRRQERSEIVCDVRERNLPAQLFAARLGFRAVGVLRDRFETDDSGATEDGYQFRYRLAGAEMSRMGVIGGASA